METPMLTETYMILSDEALHDLLVRADLNEPVTLPRKRFAALCIQAIRNGEDDQARVLVPQEQIRELMTDPHYASTAALPTDMLSKLCRQAMRNVRPRSASVTRLRRPDRQSR
jgi:hypothetical protein